VPSLGNASGQFDGLIRLRVAYGAERQSGRDGDVLHTARTFRGAGVATPMIAGRKKSLSLADTLRATNPDPMGPVMNFGVNRGDEPLCGNTA